MPFALPEGWFLTDEEKSAEIASWDALKAESERIRRWNRPGMPDPQIYNLVDAVNGVPGMCVVQSCAGHLPEEPKGEGATQPGRLWVRPSELVLDLFLGTVHGLLENPLIEQAAVLFGRGNRIPAAPVIEVVFQGMERHRLVDSKHLIITYFANIGEWDSKKGRD